MTYENLTKDFGYELEAGNTVMLLGGPGIGKSSFVQGYALKNGTRAFTLGCNTLSGREDVIAPRLVPIGKDKNGEEDFAMKFYPHIVIRNAMRYAEEHPDENPILFFDEINRCSPDTTSALLTIHTDRTVGDRRLTDNLKLVLAGNDKGNVRTLDDASVSRFSLYRVEPDVNTFLAVNKDISPYIVSVLKKNPSYIVQKPTVLMTDNDDMDDDEEGVYTEMDFDEEMQNHTNPRTIMALSRFLNLIERKEGYDGLMQRANTPDGDSNQLMTSIVGKVGNTAFALAVMQEIMNATVTQGTASSTTVTEPLKYQLLCKAGSRDELSEVIDNCSDKEKSELLVYSLYDSRDNGEILNMLTAHMGKLEPCDSQKLMALYVDGKLNKENLEMCFQNNNNITNVLRVIMNI